VTTSATDPTSTRRARARAPLTAHSCRAGCWPCGRFREIARWSGANNGHCDQCGELFIGERAFDRHIAHDKHGRMVCLNPETTRRKDGAPMFEVVFKPTWDPPTAWRTYIPGRAPWTGPDPS
jgi:hypothetical protein